MEYSSAKLTVDNIRILAILETLSTTHVLRKFTMKYLSSASYCLTHITYAHRTIKRCFYSVHCNLVTNHARAIDIGLRKEHWHLIYQSSAPLKYSEGSN